MSFKFRTKARAMELLGRKQVRDEITALIELMKNSYDADAEELTVDFTLNGSEEYLLIYEDGQGMTESEILSKWLVLGTDSKKRQKGESRLTNLRKRPLMGEKGIGRLASAALGEQFWMFTKSEKEKWHSLYLNWKIFDNPDMFMDDITIPFFIHKNKDELISYSAIETMKRIQYQNIFNSAWCADTTKKMPKDKFRELFDRINHQIKNFALPLEHLEEVFDWIEENKNQGTVLLIQNMGLDWMTVFGKDRNRDSMAVQKYDRLNSFIAPFANSVNDFEVNVFVNGEKQEFKQYDGEEIYEFYDVKIEGTIIEGWFYGQLHALNADPDILESCNKELRLGIKVTSGITDPEKKDCGPVRLMLCHFEGEKKNSGLSVDDWSRIDEILKAVGGLKVLRDRVRVLPYGEPENDFLGLEQNRSKSAGRYIFSHRHLIGEININHDQNWFLEDKSSREGLIENEQFFYFIRTIQNLLVTIAGSYLGTKGLRKSYLNYNLSEFQKKQMEDKALQNENKETRNAIKELKKELIWKEKELKALKKKGLSYAFSIVPKELKYSVIFNGYSQFAVQAENEKQKLEILKNQSHVNINPRFIFDLDVELIESVSEFNQKSDSFFEGELEKLLEIIDSYENKYQSLMNNWKEAVSIYVEDDIEKYISFNKFRTNTLKEQLINSSQVAKNIFEVMKNRARSKLQKMYEINDFFSIAENELMQIIKQFQDPIRTNLDNSINMLNSVRSFEPADVKKQIENYSNLIGEVELNISQLNKRLPTVIDDEINKRIDAYVKSLMDTLADDYSYLFGDNEIIGVLKDKNNELLKENEVYTDLANLGMAAEIVNHEFNQLFVNVADGIKNIKNTHLEPTQNYWIKQIEAGFKAISERHSQLSPMYRSYNLQKRNIKLYDIVQDMIVFFQSRFSNNQITVENKIDPNFEIMLSPSKIYPVLSNLIDNSIYWILNVKEKVVLFRSNEDRNSMFIEDSGSGITDRDKDRIFNPFFTKKIGGRGLGLSIVQKVLESQDHEIHVITKSDEKFLSGACFEIKFSDKDRV